MANNFKPWVDSPVAGQQVQSASVFAGDAQRIDGFKAGDPASALRVNSALRQANIVVAGLMQMCDDIKTLPDGLSLTSTVTQIKSAIKAAIDQLDATVLASAKSYTDTREGLINESITNVQNQVTSNKNRLDALEPRTNDLEDEVAALSGSSSTLGQRVTTLESEMDTAQADITQLKGYYEVDLTTSSWVEDLSGNYSYAISAATHKRGTRPRVHTYVNGIETYDSPHINWTTGDVTVYSDAKIALKVLIY